MSKQNIFKILIILVFCSIFSKALYAVDDDPYGCNVFDNVSGRQRIYTFYINTTGTTRNYNQTISHPLRTDSNDSRCGVLYDYTTPYSGGCAVNGITTGSFVRRLSVDTCSLDGHTFILLIIAGLSGMLLIKYDNSKLLT